MKKLVLIIFSLGFVAITKAQNIPNRDFENWSNDTVYENLVEWTTTLSDSNAIFLDNVQKSNDAQDGNHSVRLSNSVLGSDSLFGFTLLGSVGNQGPDGGISYTSDIDSVTGWWKGQIGVGDSALVLVMQFNTTETIMDAFTIGGASSTWSRFSFPLTSQTGSNDEVFIALLSSNPNISSAGGIFNDSSWILFDNVGFAHSSSTPAALPDYSFENWESEYIEEPDEWVTLNIFSVVSEDSISVEKTTDAYSGMYAMKLTSTFQSAFDDTLAIALNSNIADNLGGGFAFDEVPTNISGYYKFNAASSIDTAMIAVRLSKWNTTGDSTDEVSFQFFMLEPQANYTQFSFDLDTNGITDADFDSVNIVIVSSMYAFNGNAPLGSELFIDELWLDSKCAYADTTSLWNLDTINFETNVAEDSFFIAPSGYTSYDWSNGSMTDTLNTTTSGDYTLMVNDGTCDIIDEANFIFTFPDMCGYVDTISLFNLDTIEVDGQDIGQGIYTLSGTFIDYNWSTGDSTNSVLIEGYGYNEVSLTVTNSDGCEISDTAIFNLVPSGSINSNIFKNLLIYPNPAISIINIDFSKFERSLEKEITFFTLTGNKIMSRFVQVQNETIDISELPKGFYLMNIRIGEELAAFKVVKK